MRREDEKLKGRQVGDGRRLSSNQGASGGRRLGEVGRFSGYGLGWAFTVALLAWAGLKVDEWLGTSPAMILLGTLGGIAAGMVTVYMRTVAQPPNEASDTTNIGEEGS